MPSRGHPVSDRWRIAVVQTHPIQYMAPWFRWMAHHAPDIDLTVVYAVRPTPEAQASGFGGAFEWDVPLLDGYASGVLNDRPWDGALDAAALSAVDAPALERTLNGLEPDAVVVPGWHAGVYQRALSVCRARGWPAVYRGDSTRWSGRPGIPRMVRSAATRARLRAFDACLAVGTHAREHLLAHGVPDPLVFLSPHAVDHERLAAAADRLRAPGARRAIIDRLGLDPARSTVLFAGKLQTVKRPLDLVRALAQLGRPVQLLVAGAGPLESACRVEADRLGVPTKFAGFLNQQAMSEAYAAADLLVLPSHSETWGFAVHEALASGVPAVVSDRVGCQPDLVGAPDTGLVFAAGDLPALESAIDAVLARQQSGHSYTPACRRVAAASSFATATDGLRRALARIERRRAARVAMPAERLVACCGGMARPGGLERMTFEVLRIARRHHMAVHCIVNTWGSGTIVDLADSIDASWSTGFYWYRLERRIWRPLVAARLAWDVAATSAGLVRDAIRLKATTVLVPDYTTVLRNLPALWVLRLAGCRIVHRLGTAPDEGAGYGRLWRRAIAPVSHLLVCNSPFTAGALRRTGVPERKIRVVPNALADGRRPDTVTTPEPGRVVYAGQIIPGKGVHVLIDAMAILVARGHDVSLDVAGDIDGWESAAWHGYHAHLRRLVSSHGIDGRVRFLGWREDVPALMASAWLHVAPSLPEIREGFGLVVLEAKNAGVPSIVGASGALPDLVEHGVDGWVARTPTADALAEGLEYFLAEPSRRAAAAAAARRSLARFSTVAFEDGWMAALTGDEALHCAAEGTPCR
jgi:glycosyltransferase involved in cell wall biosynthesis